MSCCPKNCFTKHVYLQMYIRTRDQTVQPISFKISICSCQSVPSIIRRVPGFKLLLFIYCNPDPTNSRSGLKGPEQRRQMRTTQRCVTVCGIGVQYVHCKQNSFQNFTLILKERTPKISRVLSTGRYTYPSSDIIYRASTHFLSP